MRPWFEKRKNGTLVRWRDFYGEKKSSALFPSEIQARRFAQMISNQLAHQYSLESSLIKNSTLRDTAELWISSLPGVKKITVENYAVRLTHLLAALGDSNIASLSSLDLLRFAKERAKSLNSGTFWLEIRVIKRLFKFALDNMLIAMDPSRALPTSGPCREARAKRCLSWQDELRLLNSIYLPAHRAAILLMRDCGLRASDAHQLRRQNISFDPGLVKFVASKSRVQLELPLTRRLLKALSIYRDISFTRHLFPHASIERGERFRGGVLAASLSARAGFTFTLHDLRYTFRSRFKAATQDRELTEYVLGHSMRAEIKSYYFTPPTPEELREKFQQFDDYQEKALALVSQTQTPEYDIWQELGEPPFEIRQLQKEKTK